MSDGILVAHDLSDRCGPVTAAAAELASQLGVGLCALHVLPSDDLERERDSRPPESAYTDVVVDELQARLRTLVTRDAAAAGVQPARVEVLVGDPRDAITQYLARHDFDYAFLGVRNRSRVGKLVFGSVAQSVLLATPVKVVCVPLTE